MTLEETTKVMSVLKTAYPRYYDGIDAQTARQTVRLWASMLNDYSYELVINAVKALIAINKFPPVIADVIEKIQMLTENREMTELEAWSLVHKAVCNSAYNSEAEFEKLPPEIQQTVHSPEQLKTWALTPEDELNTVVASNFQRSFRVRSKQAREYAAIPVSVRKFICGISNNMGFMEEKNDEAERK